MSKRNKRERRKKKKEEREKQWANHCLPEKTKTGSFVMRGCRCTHMAHRCLNYLIRLCLAF